MQLSIEIIVSSFSCGEMLSTWTENNALGELQSSTVFNSMLTCSSSAPLLNKLLNETERGKLCVSVVPAFLLDSEAAPPKYFPVAICLNLYNLLNRATPPRIVFDDSTSQTEFEFVEVGISPGILGSKKTCSAFRFWSCDLFVRELFNTRRLGD